MDANYPGDLYRLSTDVEPFMMTQREKNGYTTSYAQIRTHHGTHADFPSHVGLDGDPKWNLSGQVRIINIESNLKEIEPVLFFNTDGEPLTESTVDKLVDAADQISVVGTNHEKVGDRSTHRRLLRNNIVIIENLVNLSKVPSNTGYAYCFAMVVAGCDDGAIVSVGFDPR